MRYQHYEELRAPRFSDFPGVGHQAIKNYVANKGKAISEKTLAKLWNLKAWDGRIEEEA